LPVSSGETVRKKCLDQGGNSIKKEKGELVKGTRRCSVSQSPAKENYVNGGERSEEKKKNVKKNNNGKE